MDTIEEIEKKLFSRSLSDVVANLEQDQRLRRVWRLIQRGYADPDLNLKQAARESGASKNHLNLLVRQTTGFSFHQLLTRYRLLQAIGLLRTKNHTILEVSFISGFGSLSAFERNFRTILGLPRCILRQMILLKESGFPPRLEFTICALIHRQSPSQSRGASG